jgi:branched-subunit amino acid ABC-type transport system permease component
MPTLADRFLQTLMDALAVGSLYALIALGYTMVYGILKFINFAHSDVFVLGAWVSFASATAAGFGAGGASADGSPATWVWWALLGLGVVGTLLWGFDKFVRHKARWSQGLPAAGSGPPLMMAAGWGLVIVGLLFVVSVVRKHEALAFLAGGLVLAIAMLTCGLVGFCVERLAYKPLRKAPRLNVLITAIGISLLLQNAGQLNWMFGTSPQRMPQLLADRVLNESTLAKGTITPGGAFRTVRLDQDIELMQGRSYRLDVQVPDRPGAAGRLRLDVVVPRREATGPGGELAAAVAVTFKAGTDLRVATTVSLPRENPATFELVQAPRVPIRLLDVIAGTTAVLLMLLLDRLVFRTKLGRAMRAVSFNPGNASLMGIPVDRVISFTFVLGAMLAAAAGFLYAQKYAGLGQPASATWVLLGLKAFVAAVVGGIGNIRGAMLGGLLIGLLEMFGVAFISPELRDVYVFAALIVVLLVRPAGILGSNLPEKV